MAVAATAGMIVALGVAIKNSDRAIAFQGSYCGQTSLPQGAQVVQVGASAMRNTITISYSTPDGGSGYLTVPFDTIAATCSDPMIRSVVTGAQRGHKEVIESMCRYVADVFAGRVSLPLDKVDHFDVNYARQWYETTCR